VERCHGVAGTTGSVNGNIPKPGPVSIHSTHDLDSPFSRAASYADTNVLVASAAHTTDNSIDF
jgi:hypothetical protein